MAYTFHTKDTGLRHCNGRTVELLGQRSPEGYDYEDVGPMFWVQFEDGTTTDVFPDELSPRPTE